MSEDSVDKEVLNTLKIVMESEFDLLINTYVKDSDVRIKDISCYSHESNPDDLRRTAHTFKGSSSNLGATHLAALCLALEEACKNENQSMIKDLIAEIQIEYKQVKKVFLEAI